MKISGIMNILYKYSAYRQICIYDKFLKVESLGQNTYYSFDYTMLNYITLNLFCLYPFMFLPPMGKIVSVEHRKANV